MLQDTLEGPRTIFNYSGPYIVFALLISVISIVFLLLPVYTSVPLLPVIVHGFVGDKVDADGTASLAASFCHGDSDDDDDDADEDEAEEDDDDDAHADDAGWLRWYCYSLGCCEKIAALQLLRWLRPPTCSKL